MNVLVACEESQAVTIELRKLGHRAFSCDLQECSGGHPEWHIQGDVLPLINGNCTFTTADTHTHTARTLGFAACISSLYLSVERWRLPPLSAQGRVKPGAVQKGTCRQRIFHEVPKRRLRQDRGREPSTNDGLSDAATDAGNPTVDVWTPGNEGNAPLASRTSAVTTDQNCRAGSAVSSVGN